MSGCGTSVGEVVLPFQRTEQPDNVRGEKMKILYVLFSSLLSSASLQAQNDFLPEKALPLNQDAWLGRHSSGSGINRYPNLVADPDYASFPDTVKTPSMDTMKYNMYGDLLNDNPMYNKRSPLWVAFMGVTGTNVATLLIDRYIFNYDFSRVGFNSWKYNITKGWEWDQDRFGMNYFFHPFFGGMYFNAARANGYSFFESVPFAFLGSLEWEYFGETTRPSYNDFINTPINGSFLGEIFYRLGSDILDDRTTGAERLFRELAVAVITPTRFLSRLFDGDLTRLTTEEVYQKEPLNLTFAAGYHRVDAGATTEKGANSVYVGLIMDYGNPFEKRSRKAFDYFRLRTDLDFGASRKIINNVTGYGMLFGGNLQSGGLEALVGLFQHMNFFDNDLFELGTLAFGPGIISKLLVSENSSLYTTVHVDVAPFGGLSSRFGPDTTQVRDYNYTGGAETKLESTYNFGGRVAVTFIGYYWWFHTYVGTAGNSYIGLIKPRIAARIFDNVSIGFEHMVYYSDRYPRDFPSVHAVRTEEKFFVQLFIEDFKFVK